MVYIPGDRYRHGTYGSASSEYVKYREVREEPHVTISRDDGIRAEGLSRQFAGLVIDSLRQQGLAVHLFAPVRDRIIRQSKAWVPAVLRANRVPVEVLVEIANLNNADDARLVRDPAFREKTSTAIVNALLHYYGQS